MSAPHTPNQQDLRPEDITIVVTVFSRREYILGAIRSAVDQSVPVKVMVAEDCGDPTLREFVLREFGSRIEYFRNSHNRGLFDNWNACLEYCRTPWISILHDDDLLHPIFVETMLGLAKAAPGRSAYFGRAGILTGDVARPCAPVQDWPKNWRDLDLAALADECLVGFPGQLMRVETARLVGGFKTPCYFTGDWDMWFRLALRSGAAQTATEVCVAREHAGEDRGSNRVDRKGWACALDNVQRKRNRALLFREKGVALPFDRLRLLQLSTLTASVLLRNAGTFSDRMLRYNAWIFTHHKPLNLKSAILQWLVRLFGPRFLRVPSNLGFSKYFQNPSWRNQ